MLCLVREKQSKLIQGRQILDGSSLVKKGKEVWMHYQIGFS